MNNSEANIYVKDTNSGLYINYDSYKPWIRPLHDRVAWIRALNGRTYEICSNINLSQKQVTHIKKVGMAILGLPEIKL